MGGAVARARATATWNLPFCASSVTRRCLSHGKTVTVDTPHRPRHGPAPRPASAQASCAQPVQAHRQPAPLVPPASFPSPASLSCPAALHADLLALAQPGRTVV